MLLEWRLRDVERKAEQANNRAVQIDSLASNVDSLERANREIRAVVDGLRSELEASLERVERLERIVELMSSN